MCEKKGHQNMCAFTLTFDEVKMESFEIHHFENQKGSAECIKQKVMNIFPVTRILDGLKGFCCIN